MEEPQPPRHRGEDPTRTRDPAELVEERHSVRAAERRLDWRRGFLASDALLILLGIWLVVSPYALSYESSEERWLPVLCGALVVVLAVLSLAGLVPRMAAVAGTAGIGVVLFIVGLALADSTAATWNAAAGGAVVAFLAIMAAAAASEATDEGPAR